MRRTLIALIVLPLAYLAGRALVYALVPDATQIRWRLQDAAEAFSDGNPFGAVAPLANEWRHEDAPIDRDRLRSGLFRLVLEARDPDTGAFVYDATLDEDALAIEVDDDGTAFARGEITFRRVVPEPPEVVWRVRFEADLALRDATWRIVSSRHETLEGERIR